MRQLRRDAFVSFFVFLFLSEIVYCQMEEAPLLSVDQESLMTVPEIIRHYGYPVEEHKVMTEDDYILTVHRIPHGRNESPERKNETRPVVFLQHGLLCSSSMWVLNLPAQSAGFIFADAGFDVWMGNSRGNIYSQKHASMDSDSEDYWKFSWEEMAMYDLPAVVDGILLFTKQPYLYFIGHSQGNLMMFARQATDPSFASKIRKNFALAPIGRLGHVQGLFHYLGKMYDQFKALMTLFGDSQFLPNNLLTRVLADLVCDAEISSKLCTNLIFMVSGPDSRQFNHTRIPIYLAHNPAGTSMRTIVHYAQMVHYKRMSPYDLGHGQNLKKYGAPIPPEYDISRVSSPTYLFYSDSDWLAAAEDVESFFLRFLNKNVLKFATKLNGFNHNDFMWGLQARKEIYDPIANIIRQDVRRQEIAKTLGKRKEHFRFRKQARHLRGLSKHKKEKLPELDQETLSVLLQMSEGLTPSPPSISSAIFMNTTADSPTSPSTSTVAVASSSDSPTSASPPPNATLPTSSSPTTAVAISSSSSSTSSSTSTVPSEITPVVTSTETSLETTRRAKKSKRRRNRKHDASFRKMTTPATLAELHSAESLPLAFNDVLEEMA